jgi:sugar lactone lactonase YvrE
MSLVSSISRRLVAVSSVVVVVAGGVVSAVATPLPPNPQPGEITTAAGGGGILNPLATAPASQIALSSPAGVAADSAGDLFVADTANSVIREISPDGTSTTVAGVGVPGKTGDNGPATSAELNRPRGVCVDGAGDVFIVDTANHEVREVSGGTITLFAGNGTPGYSGDGGAATSAQLSHPRSCVVADGGVFISDTANDVVRFVKFGAPPVIMTAIGGGAGGIGDGGPATAARLQSPTGLAADPANGTVYVADFGHSAVRKVPFPSGVAAGGNISTAAHAPYPRGVAFDAAGDLIISDPDENQVLIHPIGGTNAVFAGTGAAGESGDLGPATAAKLDGPSAVASDGDGNIFIADTDGNRVREVVAAVAPTFTTVSAPDAIAAGGHYTAQFHARGVAIPTYGFGPNPPAWLSIDSATGAVSGTVPAGTKNFTYSVTATNQSATATAGPVTVTVAPTFTFKTLANPAALKRPYGLSVRSDGTYDVPDATANKVIELTPSLIVAGSYAPPSPGAFLHPQWSAQNFSSGWTYVVDSGNNRVGAFDASHNLLGFAGSLGSGAGQFKNPAGIAQSPTTGDLFIADSGNNRIEVLGADGSFVGTFSSFGSGNGQLNKPLGVAIDTAGRVLVADSGNSRIAMFTQDGDWAGTFGKPGTARGQLTTPTGVTVSSGGDVFVTDSAQDRVEVFNSNHQSVAQFGVPGIGAGQFDTPTGIVLTTGGVLTISDAGNHRLVQWAGPIT